jgi:uncharacterized protein (DUF1684 family)
LAGCERAPSARLAVTAEHQADVDAWKARRDARLRAEDGWLSLVNLAWLEPGENSVGAAADNRVVLIGSDVPDRVGAITLAPAGAMFTPAPGVAVAIDGSPVTGPAPIASDTDGPPTVLAVGSVRFHLIDRNERVAVRVRDTQSAVRAAFGGMEYWPIDPEWRIVARFEPHDPPKTIPVPNALGWTDQSPSPGVAVFEKDGKTYRLEPILEPGQEDYFFVFGDRTNGSETYGGGRFLYSKPVAADGTVVLDFNKSYNPPCVFSAYATCPLPPPQNKLPFALRAGEKKYTGPSAGPIHA